MADEPKNVPYGLSKKEARMLGLLQEDGSTKDVELEAAISRQFRNMRLSHMKVKVKAGVATLFGTVDDYTTKRELLSRIRGMQGVKKVASQIRVISRSGERPRRGFGG